MAGRPDPKPAKRPRKKIRIEDREATTRVLMHWPSCVVCGRPASNGHHVVRRGSPHFGDDVEENILSVCGSGTTGCHGKAHAGDTVTRMAMGVHMLAFRMDVLRYIVAKLGSWEAADAWARRFYFVGIPEWA